MERQVTVLKRALVLKASTAYNVNPGDIVCVVKGSTGNVYVTTLRRNKQHTCTCKGNVYHGHCYHVDQLKKIENARFDAEKAYAMSDALHAKLATIATSEQISNYEEGQISFVEPAQELAPVTATVAAIKVSKASDEAFKSALVRKQGKKLIKNIDHRSAQTLAFFSNLPSRQLVESR